MARHEELPDRVVARLRKIKPKLRAFRRKESVRDLREHAASIAERRISPDRAAMIEIGQDLQALFENVVRPAVFHVGHEADAAGIMLIGRIVEALGARGQRIHSRGDARSRASEALVELGLSVHFPLPKWPRSFRD